MIARQEYFSSRLSTRWKVIVKMSRCMKTLSHEDSFYIQAATGWLELGNHREASEELRRVAPSSWSHPNFLEALWQISAKQKKWQECFEIAQDIMRISPGWANGWIHRASALHELKRTQEAVEILLPAVELFPENPTIPYNLASYETWLGDYKAACFWLTRAFSLDDPKTIKLRALDDPNFARLWRDVPNF
jgi:tetratricopeptide (TPR) repeat protein